MTTRKRRRRAPVAPPVPPKVIDQRDKVPAEQDERALPYHVLPPTAIPLQAASKLVGWVAYAAVERLEVLINRRADQLLAALRRSPHTKKRRRR
jgi:hypothetical protein